LNAKGFLTGKGTRRWLELSKRTVVTGTEEATDTEGFLASVTRLQSFGGMSYIGSRGVALRTGLDEAGAVHATGGSFGEGNEGSSSGLRVDAFLAVLTWSGRGVTVPRVCRGIDAAVVEGEAGGAEFDHCVWHRGTWSRSRGHWIHFDEFLEKTDQWDPHQRISSRWTLPDLLSILFTTPTESPLAARKYGIFVFVIFLQFLRMKRSSFATSLRNTGVVRPADLALVTKTQTPMTGPISSTAYRVSAKTR
jgi:hypothetical protein